MTMQRQTGCGHKIARAKSKEETPGSPAPEETAPIAPDLESKAQD
jgi:hypothetical protein